jgi:hypothetical protein
MGKQVGKDPLEHFAREVLSFLGCGDFQVVVKMINVKKEQITACNVVVARHSFGAGLHRVDPEKYRVGVLRGQPQDGRHCGIKISGIDDVPIPAWERLHEQRTRADPFEELSKLLRVDLVNMIHYSVSEPHFAVLGSLASCGFSRFGQIPYIF